MNHYIYKINVLIDKKRKTFNVFELYPATLNLLVKRMPQTQIVAVTIEI